MHVSTNSCEYSADEHDEIDVELVGGDPAHWQTNIFAPSTKDKGPLWGVFSGVEEVSAKSSKVQSDITSLHKYTIDWTEQRIVWSVDDTVVRTLHKGEYMPRLAGSCLSPSPRNADFSGDRGQRDYTLSVARGACTARHLGCQQSRWNLRMGERSYRLENCSKADVGDVQECQD